MSLNSKHPQTTGYQCFDLPESIEIAATLGFSGSASHAEKHVLLRLNELPWRPDVDWPASGPVDRAATRARCGAPRSLAAQIGDGGRQRGFAFEESKL